MSENNALSPIAVGCSVHDRNPLGFQRRDASVSDTHDFMFLKLIIYNAFTVIKSARAANGGWGWAGGGMGGGGGGQGRIYGRAGQTGHMPRDPHQKGPRQNGPSSDLGQGRLAPPPKGPPPNGASLPPRKKCIWQLTSPLNISCPGAPTVLNPAQELLC